jgi:4a-hydroxytetrahydrobiopterin dehydratase
MTETLAEKTCTPCRGGVAPLGRDEALRFQAQAPDWELRDDARRIERTFQFPNFREALAFVQQVGELAESEGHHPDISFGWGRATVSLSTKKIKGLHQNDFIMASKGASTRRDGCRRVGTASRSEERSAGVTRPLIQGLKSGWSVN